MLLPYVMQLRDKKMPPEYEHKQQSPPVRCMAKFNDAFLLTKAVGSGTWATMLAEVGPTQLNELLQKKRRPCFNLKQSLTWKAPILNKL